MCDWSKMKHSDWLEVELFGTPWGLVEGGGARELKAHINIRTCSKITSVYYEIRIRTRCHGDWVGGERERVQSQRVI